MDTPRKLYRRWWLVLLPVLALICVLIAQRVVKSMDYHHNDNDFFTFWLAGHLVAQGGSPYDPQAWLAGYHQNAMDIIPNPAFLYPLPLALLFAPLGLLPFVPAYVTWVTLLQLLILASLGLILLAEPSPRAKYLYLPLLAGVILFRPATLTITQGQVSGLFLFILAAMALLWQRGKWLGGGVLLGLLVLKPNLGLILLAALGFWLVLHKRWSALAGALLSGCLLLLAGLIYAPGWVGQYWSIGANKLSQTFGGSPTVWGLSALVCRAHSVCVLTLGGAAAALLVLGFLWLGMRLKSLSPLTVIALSICLTLLVAPYTWTYDQLLLLLPVTLVALALDRGGKGLLAAGLVFIAIDVLALLLLFFDVALQVEILNVFVPLAVLVLVLVFAIPRRA